MSTAQYLAITIMSLLISSSLISLVIYNKEMTEIEKINLNLPETNINQNYINNSFDESFIKNGSSYQRWVYINGLGYRSPPLNILGNFYDRFYLENVIPINNVYTAVYNLNNSVHSDFIIYVRYCTVPSYIIELHFDSMGIHIPNNLLSFLLDYDYSYPNINLIDSISIETQLNQETNKLKVLINGNEQFNINIHSNFLNIFPTKYAGISASKEGLFIETINTRLSESGSFDLIDLFNLFMSIIFWNVDEKYLPLILNIILIKTQLIAVILCFIAYVRGI